MDSYALKLFFLDTDATVEPWLFGDPTEERLRELMQQYSTDHTIVTAQLVRQDPWTVLAEQHNMVVGRALYLNFRERRQPNLTRMIVTKIGRKWIELGGNGNQRIDKDTFQIDGGQYTSPGRAYWTEAQYEDEQATKAAWTSFTNTIHHGPLPKGLTAEKVQKAAEILGVKFPLCVPR